MRHVGATGSRAPAYPVSGSGSPGFGSGRPLIGYGLSLQQGTPIQIKKKELLSGIFEMEKQQKQSAPRATTSQVQPGSLLGSKWRSLALSMFHVLGEKRQSARRRKKRKPGAEAGHRGHLRPGLGCLTQERERERALRRAFHPDRRDSSESNKEQQTRRMRESFAGRAAARNSRPRRRDPGSARRLRVPEPHGQGSPPELPPAAPPPVPQDFACFV